MLLFTFRNTIPPIFLFIFGSVFLSAQVDLSVILEDENETNNVSGIEVLLENENIGFEEVVTTNEQGKAIFKNLSISGFYSVSVVDDNYEESKVEGIALRSNDNATVVIPLYEKGVDLESVVIRSNPTTKLNTKNAEVSAQLLRSELEAVPIEGRDITRTLFRLPNVTQATGFFPEAPNVSINGANALFTNYLIDGLDNNERFLGGQKFAIPLGFSKNVTVLTNNFSAEFGNTANGLVNVTTLSGTNDLKGEVFFVTRPGPAIDGQSDFAQRDLSGNQVADGFQRYQGGFGIGGAIKKDKTFFYLNAEHTTDLKDNLLNPSLLNISETIRGENHFTYLSGKIDHKWSDDFRSSLRANLGIVNIDRQGGGVEGGINFPSTANEQDRNSFILASKNIYSKRNFSSETNIQYSRFRWDYADAENASSPRVSILNNGVAVANIGHPGFSFDSRENTWQLQQKVKLYLNKHTLKFGAELISADHSLLGGGAPNGAYVVDLTTAQLNQLNAFGSALNVNDLTGIIQSGDVQSYNVELNTTRFGKTQNITSFYIEDLFSINNRLNITLGLRYDYDNLSKGGNDEGDTNNFAPRFSLNYRLNNRMTIRAGTGIFYDKINYAVYSDALQQNTTGADFRAQLQEFIRLGILPSDTDLDRVTFDGNLTATLDGVNTPEYLQGPSASTLQGQRNSTFSNDRRILNPNGYDNPYAWQSTIGFQYQIKPKLLFYSDIVYNRSYDLFRLRNLNAVSEYDFTANGNLIRTTEQADLTRPVPIQDGSATINGQVVTGVGRNVIVTETEGEAEFIGWSVNLRKERADDQFSYLISYTLSSLKNDTDGINFRASSGNNFEREWGYSINDRRHVINSLVNYYPTKNITVSLASLIQSGQPINRIPDALELGFTPTTDVNGNTIFVDANGTQFTTDLDGDGFSFADGFFGNNDRFPGESRNNDRLPWAVTFDLGFQYDFKLNKKHNLELRADIFNLLNAENLSGYSNNATQSNQIQEGSRASGNFTQRNASPPRQFQFGLRYIF